MPRHKKPSLDQLPASNQMHRLAGKTNKIQPEFHFEVGHIGYHSATTDVRICVVRFLMAFLITNDSGIVEQLLTHRELMKSIFKGLRQDRMSTLHLILPTMQQYIVCNTSVSKTQKLRLFNDYTLPQVATLYDWQGVNDMQEDDDGKSTVRQLVHGFLLEVTCNLKHGINFHDKTMGTSGRSHNATLLKFALTQKSVSEDDLRQELVIKILQTCPDILNAYLSKCSLSFAPRNSKIWQKNMAFVMKIYSLLQVSSIVSNLRESTSMSKMVSMAMVATVPAFMTQTMIVQGLKQGGTVAYTLLELIQSILNQCQKITEAFMLRCPDKRDFIIPYHSAIKKALPDVNTVLPVWQKVLLKWKEEIAPSKKQEVSERQESVTSVTNLQLLGKIMEVLCAYQQVIPSHLEQTSHDFTLMIHNIFLRGWMGDHSNDTIQGKEQQTLVSDLLRLQCHCLEFLMGFSAGRFRWFKEVKGEGTAMNRLLSELTLTSQPELHKNLKQLVNKILLETCLFEHSPTEVSIWLDHLMTLDLGDRPEVVDFLQSCLTKTIRNPHPYNDKVADCVAAGQSSRQQHLQGDQTVVKSFCIEDIPEVSDINMDPSVQTDCDKSTESSHWKTLWPDLSLPCSALLPVTLERFTQEASCQNSDSVATYITSVSITILHQQVDPLPFCLLLQQYSEIEGKPASQSKSWQKMLKYSNFWLQQKKTLKKPPSDSLPKTLIKELQSATTFSALFQACFESSPQSLLHDEIWSQLKAKITELSVGQSVSATRHVLLYLHTLLDMQTQIHGHTLMDLVHKHMILILNIVNHAIVLESKLSDQKGGTANFPLSPASKNKAPRAIDWNQLALVILKHPVYLYWFQWSASGGEESSLEKDPEEAGKISAIISGYILKFIKKFSILVTAEDFKEAIRHYACKTFLDLKMVVGAYCSLLSVNEDDDLASDAAEEVLRQGNKKEVKLEAGDQDARKDLDVDDSDEKTSASSSLNSSEFFDKDHLKELTIFSLLSAYARQNDVSNVVCSFLTQQPELLLQEGADGPSTVDLTHLGKVICALAICCEEDAASLRVGGLLGDFFQTTGLEEVGRALLAVMTHSRKQVLFPNIELLFDFLNNPTEIRAKIAEKMIRQSFAHACQFESWCLSKRGERSLAENKVELLSVFCAYWETQSAPATKDGVTTLNKLWTIYWPWLSSWFAGDQTYNELTSETQVKMSTAFSYLLSAPKTTSEMVASLLRRTLAQCLKEETLLAFVQMELGLMSQAHKDESIQTLVLALQLQQMTVLTKNEGTSGIRNLISDCYRNWSKTTHTINMSSCPELPQIWKEFTRQILKNEYERSLLHGLLSSLIPVLYGDPDHAQKLVSLERLFQMIISHSKFLPSMLAESNGEDIIHATEVEVMKGSLARLMLAIARLEPSCCQTAHFAVMLGAYSASLLTSDRHLLTLMNVYENNNTAMWEYRPYMWGPVAITQHASRKALGQNLWQQPTMREVLELLDPAKLHQSALKFPLDRRLQETDDDYVSSSDTERCYDPCFLLPLFSHLLAPESVADCKKFTECHALEFTMAALGSYDPVMRTAAYHVLSAFHQHIRGARLMGKRELMYLIECLRNSITEPNCRLPNVVALFIGRMTTVMMSPSQHIYPVLVQFLTLKPQIQLNNVPMFNRLFYSTNLKHGKEREWMMQLLLDGLRDADDFQVYEKTGIFKTLLAFQLSVLCGETLNNQIFELLEKACAIPEAAYQLIRQHSLLTWIDAHINKDSNISSLQSIITLLHILSKSVLTTSDLTNNKMNDGKDIQKEMNYSNSKKDQSHRTTRPNVKGDDRRRAQDKLPVGSSELLFSICVGLLDHLKPLSAVKPVLLQEYLETLRAVCQYHKLSAAGPTSTSASIKDGLPLRARHIAQLLLLYATTLRKTDLLIELASVSANPAAGKERAGKMDTSPSHTNVRKIDIEEHDPYTDLAPGEQVEEMCSCALVSVVTHWTPFIIEAKEDEQVIIRKERDSEQETERQEYETLKAESAPSSDRNQFVLLVMKWVLSTVFQGVGITEDHWQSALTFVRKILDNSAGIQQCVIAARGLGKDIIELLLSLLAGDRNPKMKTDAHLGMIETSVNQIFLQLVVRLQAQSLMASLERESVLVRSVKTTYEEPLEMCQKLTVEDSDIDSRVSRQLIALLMRELWVGADQPHHFWAAWNHCIGNKERKKKRRSTDEGDVENSSAKKKKQAKRK